MLSNATRVSNNLERCSITQDVLAADLYGAVLGAAVELVAVDRQCEHDALVTLQRLQALVRRRRVPNLTQQ